MDAIHLGHVHFQPVWQRPYGRKKGLFRQRVGMCVAIGYVIGSLVSYYLFLVDFAALINVTS